eukprot:SAG22_NODE_5869_length_939_cov_0.986905_1_plen_272_part_01
MLLVDTNGRLFDPALTEWREENASSSACGCFGGRLPSSEAVPSGKGQDGCDASGAPGFYREGISSGSFLAVMDPNSSYYQQKLATVSAAVITAIKSDGIYLDQLGCSHAMRCFEGGRGGGGSSWAAGTRTMLVATRDAIRRAANNNSRPEHGAAVLPVPPIIAEAADEQYLGLVPINLAIYNWEFPSHCTSVPAYSAVYGGYAVNVGDNRYPWTSRAVMTGQNEVDQQRGMLAQQFVTGNVLGWMALEELALWMGNATFKADIGFFGLLARL